MYTMHMQPLSTRHAYTALPAIAAAVAAAAVEEAVAAVTVAAVIPSDNGCSFLKTPALHT